MIRISGVRQDGSAAVLMAVLLAAGLAIRIRWIDVTDAATRFIDVGEATRAAIALAEQGVIGDAFFPGQGPTAHVMPVMVAVAAAIFRLFGTYSETAGIMLTGWALAQVFASYLLTRLLFQRIGAESNVLAAGIAVLALVPAHIAQECVDFRFWEGALATCLAMLNLCLIVALDQRPEIRRKDLALAASLAAATFFVSPTIGLAIDACWAWFAFRRLSLGRTIRFAGISAAALASVIAPWMLRNYVQLGSPGVLRSNFGLELAIANHPGAVSPEYPAVVLNARMLEIHPLASSRGKAMVRNAGGEVAYARKLGSDAMSWISDHPLDFAALSLRHYRQFYIPERWQETLTNWKSWERPRNEAIRFISLLGLIGLAIGLVRRRRYYNLLAIYLAVAGLPYALVQPIPRYSYVVWGILAFLAAQLIVDLIALLQRKLQRQSARSLALDAS